MGKAGASCPVCIEIKLYGILRRRDQFHRQWDESSGPVTMSGHALRRKPHQPERGLLSNILGILPPQAPSERKRKHPGSAPLQALCKL